MIDTTTIFMLMLLISSVAALAYLIGYTLGSAATIKQLAREINERNTKRKTDWLKHQQ